MRRHTTTIRQFEKFIAFCFSFINKFEYIYIFSELQLARARSWCVVPMMVLVRLLHACFDHAFSIRVHSINGFSSTWAFPSYKSILLNANAKQAYFSNRHRINSKRNHNELISGQWNASSRVYGKGFLSLEHCISNGWQAARG